MALTANITMPTAAAADVANAPAGMWRMFFDSSNGNQLSAKDSAGTVVVIGSGSAVPTLQEVYESGNTIDLKVGKPLNIGNQLADGDAPVDISVFASEGYSPSATGPGNSGGNAEYGGGNGGDSPDDVGGDGGTGGMIGGDGGNGTTGGSGAVAGTRGGKGGDGTLLPGLPGSAELRGGQGGSVSAADVPAAAGAPAHVEGGLGGQGADLPTDAQGGPSRMRGGLTPRTGLRAPVYIQDAGDPNDANQVNSGSGSTTWSHTGAMRTVPVLAAYDAGPDAYIFDLLKSNACLVAPAENTKPFIFTSVSSALDGQSGTVRVQHSGANTGFSSWGASGGLVKFPGGVAPVLSIGDGAIDVLRWDVYDGNVLLTLVALDYQ